MNHIPVILVARVVCPDPRDGGNRPGAWSDWMESNVKNGTTSQPWAESDPVVYAEFCCWPGCGEDFHDAEGSPPLCMKHLIKVAAFMVPMIKDKLRPDPPNSTPAEVAARRERQDRIRAAQQEQSVVYYIRLGDRVKIGTTVNLRARMGSFMVTDEALLATEPGGRELEAQRHQEFAEERVVEQGGAGRRRELFNPSIRLLAHIDDVRAEHGEPCVTTYVRVA